MKELDGLSKGSSKLKKAALKRRTKKMMVSSRQKEDISMI